MGLQSPCLACKKRQPGCHNVLTCPAWAEYERRKRKEIRTRNFERVRDVLLHDYARSRAKYLHNTRRGKNG